MHLLTIKRGLIRSGKHGQDMGEELVGVKQTSVVVGGKEVSPVVEGLWERRTGCRGGEHPKLGISDTQTGD